MSSLQTAIPALHVQHNKTDNTRWRLRDNDSRHTWHYLSAEEAARHGPQSAAEKYFLGLPLDNASLPRVTSPSIAAQNGFAFFERLQMPSGHWGGENGGPMLFSSGIVIALFVTNTAIAPPLKIELTNYITSKVNPDDGGWGLHTTGESTVCGTSINYCVLRLLGLDPKDPILVKARSFIHKNGGAIQSSIWGKFWLAVLGVVDWDIVNPIPPEIWLLPEWLPIAPWRLYAEIRAASQSMGYLYSKRWSFQGEIVDALREELLVQPYLTIDWQSHRNSVAKIDYKQPRSVLLNCATWFYVNIWKPYLLTDSLKQRAESFVSQLIDMQDLNTSYLGIAATDAPMNTIICYVRDGPDSITFQKHAQRLQEFFWMTPEGMVVSSTNGSQCWDTAHLIQAACSGGFDRDPRWQDMLLKAYRFLERQQIRENATCQEICYRQPRKGGWAFSNKAQGYAVSDCIAESLKAVLLLWKDAEFPQIFDDDRIFDAVDSILLYQNKTGGVSAFEARRGGEYLDQLNISEIFTRFMIDYDYPECTSSCITALSLFRQYWPKYRSEELTSFIQKGTTYIKQNQRPDGSWYGNWGICFTYATMFALESLGCVGELYNTSDSSKRGCDFLISKQREDGGWSENFKSCETMEYHEDPQGSLVNQTAWALIGLIEAGYPDPEPLLRGAHFLMSRQQRNGEWLDEGIPGSFHGFCTFGYPNYKFVFPLKALGLMHKVKRK
ncbi:terpenoid cyclases/protein prenyltransferase alpha-alpha toroid [Xylariales sp. PMI_506]|nr:terpenoid cyclases/protein prenyltransferase alpha-alpha toroid [Xylariales sp. PMI_506]